MNSRYLFRTAFMTLGASFLLTTGYVHAGAVWPYSFDNDRDGYSELQGDCDDAEPSIYPNAEELCDGIDQDCDGLADVENGAKDQWERLVCGAVIVPGASDVGILGFDQPTVLYNEALSKYQMWFRIIMDDPYDHAIGYAESTNGRDWARYTKPVLYPGEEETDWDHVRIGSPSVILHEGIYHMWYHGNETSNKIRIGHAVSANGFDWTKDKANPVVYLGAPGTWDQSAVHAPSVMYDPDRAIFKMWYSGSNGPYIQIGYAESPHGTEWTKYSQPVLPVGEYDDWDDKRAVFQKVIKVDGVYHMWYSGDDHNLTYTYEIGYAWSDDGINWIKDVDPVFSFDMSGSPDAFDEFMVYSPAVIDYGDGMAMYYAGANDLGGPFEIGMAFNLTPY